MIIHRVVPAILVLVMLILSFACKRGKEMVTNSGMKYILYTENKGAKAAVGDYVTIDLVYKTRDDSVLFDSRKNETPLRFELKKIPFRGSFEEGLTCLSTGDSATFFVPADSLYKYLYGNQTPRVPQEHTAFTKGSFIKFDIKLRRVQNYIEAEQEIEMEYSKLQKKEQSDLSNYIRDKKIGILPDNNGVYLISHKDGTGVKIDSTCIVTLLYTGRFLNDSIFDSTKKLGRPYRFVPAHHQVIAGWEEVIPSLKKGSSVTLILPSALCYGEKGLRNPDDGTFIVPPYTPLVFDLEIVNVEPLASLKQQVPVQ